MNPTAFYYICHVENVPSILEHGLLSRESLKEKGVVNRDIHDPEALSRREAITVGESKRKLSHFVNLYFEPRNAMTYRLQCNISCGELVVLEIDRSVMEKEGVHFSDGNAASSNVRFYSDLRHLDQIDKKVFDKEYWSDGDNTKQKMMAEMLVPVSIHPDCVTGLITAGQGFISDSLNSLLKQRKIPVIVQPNKFFYPVFSEPITERLFISQGDMFFSSMQTFTVSVNLKGVMGKGLASRTKYQFPDAYVRYQDDCKSGKLKIGKPTLYKRAIRIEEELADDQSLLSKEKLNGERWFLFFPTKRHWKDPARFEDVEKSMRWLVENHRKQGVESIALPALGCGLGQLTWEKVGPMMCHYLNQIDIRSVIYLPMEKKPDRLQLDADFLLHSHRPG